MKKITEDMTVAAQAIYDRDGSLRSTTLLEVARDEHSPLHSYFEWDDTKAAEKYRRIQARWFCSNIRLVDARHNKEPAQLIHIPSLDRRSPGEYKTAPAVVKVRSELERALDEILGEIFPLENKLKKLESLAKKEDLSIEPILIARQSLQIALESVRKIRPAVAPLDS